MIQKREKVFETNSSSSHSLVITDALTIDYKPNPALLGREIDFELGSYGWGYESYNDFHGKASYLFTGIAQLDANVESWGENLVEDITEAIRATERGAMVIRVIEAVTGQKVVVRNSRDAHIDHQSAEEYQQALTDDSTLKQFLFSSRSEVVIDNDNH